MERSRGVCTCPLPNTFTKDVLPDAYSLFNSMALTIPEMTHLQAHYGYLSRLGEKQAGRGQWPSRCGSRKELSHPLSHWSKDVKNEAI